MNAEVVASLVMLLLVLLCGVPSETGATLAASTFSTFATKSTASTSGSLAINRRRKGASSTTEDYTIIFFFPGHNRNMDRSSAPTGSPASSFIASAAPTWLSGHSATAPVTPAHPPYNETNLTTSSGAPYYFSSCETALSISSSNPGNMSSELLSFTYQMTLTTGATTTQESKIPTVELALNNYLSKKYLGACDFTNAQFQVLTMSSLPMDTTGAACTNGVPNCLVMNGFFTAQVFYWKNRRSLQTAATTDPLLLSSFGSALSDFFHSANIADPEIKNLTWVGLSSNPGTTINNGEYSGGGNSAGGTTAGITQSVSQPANSGSSNVRWGATIMGLAVVATLAVGVIVVRRHRRRPMTAAIAKQQKKSNHDEYDEDGARQRGNAESLETSGDLPMRHSTEIHCLGDDLEDESGNIEVVGYPSGSNRPNRPSFISMTTKTQQEKRDRSGRPYSSPDTLDL